ncbi:pleckstrin homology domain-containing family G member 4B [Trichonephila inaurata madagascariensis]|uniref:Pleckstrin homology domain-containing family G member 4B n=1 Tax=Trichonephila inaurata madagascariensis TaxID=2747483 RepID=A0A8X6Y561_9ARAC|nr:pleckstrin homology domain-containing family G member 4B [Trichonephila inaurata madagascariensis]
MNGTRVRSTRVPLIRSSLLDTEPKVDPPQENNEPACPPPKSPLPEVKQHSAISSLVENAFSSRVAIMPGSRDMCCRSVVYISLENMQNHNIEPVHLAEILLYFQSIPKRETICLGFLVIVDGRNVETESWGDLHKTLALVEETVPGTISLVLALQKHKTEFLSSKYPIFHIKFEPIVNENQLLQYVAKDQLLLEFGGTYEYDHQEWTNFHEFLDPFIVSCHQTGCRLVQLIQDLRYGQLPSILTHQLIEEQKKQIMEVLENEQLRYLEGEGTGFLKKLEEYRSTFRNNLDYEEAVEKSKMLYKQLKKVVQRLARLADKRLSKLQECMMLKVFEEESSQVLSWLHRKGEETLKKHKTLAETLNAIREQENEFEKFYFLAMRQIERGNDLLEEIPKLQNSDKENGISANLKKQLDDFTDRLEDARETLEDTSRCYQLLDKTYEWSLETMRFVSHMKVDSTTSVNALVTIMKRLESYLQEHPYLEDGIFEEMTQLTLKLNNPNLSNQCQVAKAKYEETVDLVQARLETLIKAKERLSYEERPNINDSLDNLKIKPCLWNPLSQNVTYRSSSQSHLGSFSPSHGSQGFRREAVGSYTAFPSSYYPASSFRERLLGLSQRKKRTDYFSKRGSLTDEVVLGRVNTSESDSSSRTPHGRKSYPFSSDSLTNLNMQISSIDSKELQSASSQLSKTKLDTEGNWKIFDSELKKYADEVREQNRMLEQNRLVVQQETVNLRNRNTQENYRPMSANYTTSNPEELQKPAPVNSHLMRCASCSDFEELLSGKTSEMENLKLANNRTLKLVMMEMIQTERDYVKSLGYIIENYMPLLQNSNVSQSLRSQRNVIFGNIEKIYEFHNCYFLQELEQCESVPYSVGQCFLKYESQFYLYALYNKNKPKSDSLLAEYGNNFFKKKQHELGDKMDLASYLLKPVQRMGKYALLLKQLLKECPETSSEHYNNLKAAEEMVRFQLRHGNDLLAMDALRECDVNIKEQGRLLRQDEFLVCQGGKSRKALRHVFLFEDLIIFSKARRDPSCKGNEYYQYKSSMKTSDLGLTAQVGESATKFEIWFRKCKTQDLYVLQAPSAEIKNAWVEEVSGLLWKQAERNRNLRLEEMSSMGIGNKPCLDITPSRDQICDRSISLQQLNKVPRFRNSIAVSSSDNFNNNEPRRRPLSIISLGGSSSSGDGQGTSIFYDTTDPLEEVEETEADKRRSVAQQSQCSAESGIFTDLSTSGDSYVENVNRLKTVERSDSLLSRTSYNSIEATSTETSTATSSLPSGLAV